MKKTKILVVDSPDVDGVVFWRNLLPLCQMAKDYADLEFKFVSEEAKLYDLLSADVAIFFRPVKEKTLNFIRTCKAKMIGLKVIIDLDDNLWRLPPGHPSELDYLKHQDSLNSIYAIADAVWCSTEPLLPYADAMDGRGFVIPNAIRLNMLPDRPARFTGRICWRGGSSQIDDITAPHAIEFYNENKALFSEWVFWGYWPREYHVPGCKAIPRMDLINYMNALPNSGINAMWKPLVDNEFNDAKSNIAFLEATMAGGVCFTNYAFKPGWEKCFSVIGEPLNESFVADAWEDSVEFIKDRHDVREINKIRYESIKSLT